MELTLGMRLDPRTPYTITKTLDSDFVDRAGLFGQAQIRGFGSPCRPKLITKAKREYLHRISRDLHPKC